ncbi:lipoprotein [Mycoplasma feriruminatoris]|uniref:Lipoprotein n=1 Tax=Mycoplasma feriruminatoris TaxID=1179777 RepID=A0AAQ3DN11_9MOLU|nr:lipoprotein [Mycoplasma feriruminatoris]WFQ95268.1 lipoprotein [Mycoplasma feriruminatoris]
MKKLLTILGSVGLVATTGAVVVACGQKSAMNDKKQGKEEKIVLEKLIKTRELGFVSKNDSETIKKAFIKQNLPKDVLDKVDVIVTTNGSGTNGAGVNDNLNDSAVVELKDKTQGNGNSTKKVTVVFDVNNDLSKIVKVTKLKSLADNKDETIIAALDKANPKANLDSSKLMIERKDNKVILKAKDSATYTGQVEVHIESKTGVYVGLSLLSVALLASSGFIIYRSVKKKKKQM